MNTGTSRTRRIGRFGAGAAIAGGTRLLLRRMAGDFERDHHLRPSTAVGVYGAYVVQLAAVTELVRHPRLRVPIPPLAGRVLGGSLIAAGSGARCSGCGQLSQCSP